MKGKKVCEQCQTICAARTKECQNCQAVFVRKKRNVDVVVKEPNKIKIDKLSNLNKETEAFRKVMIIPAEYSEYDIRSTIIAPAGYCPITLKKDPTDEDLISWSHELRILFLERNKEWLLNRALSYYLRYDYDYNSKKYKDMEKVIDQIPDLKYINV